MAIYNTSQHEELAKKFTLDVGEGFIYQKMVRYLLKYLNPIKLRASLIFAPSIFAQLNNSYIRTRIIFAHWQNLYFRVGLSYEICAEEKSANDKW